MNTTATQDDLVSAALGALERNPSEPQQDPVPDPDMETFIPSAPSPTLENLDKRRRPNPATVCESCPNSVWFTSPKEVKCYCRVMYLITWSTRDPNHITSCDGIFVGREY